MPRKPAANELELRLREILSRTAQDIAAAVRADFAGEIRRLIGEPSPAGRAGRRRGPAAGEGEAAVTPSRGRRRRRRRGAGPKGAAAAKPGRPRRAGGDVDARILGVIVANPGLRAEQIRAHVGLSPNEVKAVLARLREAKRVTTVGQARGTTYTAA